MKIFGFRQDLTEKRLLSEFLFLKLPKIYFCGVSLLLFAPTTIFAVGLITITLFVFELEPFERRSQFFSENLYPALALWNSVCARGVDT